MHSLMIIRHGDVVAEGWWSPYAEERVHLLYSLSKSFTSTAAAFAIAEGLLDLDATMLSYFPEFDSEITDPHSRSMLGRHVAAMASGHRRRQSSGRSRSILSNLYAGSCSFRPIGSLAACSPTTSRARTPSLRSSSGLPTRPLTAYLRPRLLDPLGIGEVGWQQYPNGRDIGYSGLHATTDAIDRLGFAVPAAWSLERSAAAVGGVGRPGHPGAVGNGNSVPTKSGLATGIRVPVLDVPTRVPRRRRIRAVLRGASRTGRGDRHHCRDREHAGHPRLGMAIWCPP
jgi:CubicO group peptidase (beta-lactamase class C family)